MISNPGDSLLDLSKGVEASKIPDTPSPVRYTIRGGESKKPDTPPLLPYAGGLNLAQTKKVLAKQLTQTAEVADNVNKQPAKKIDILAAGVSQGDTTKLVNEIMAHTKFSQGVKEANPGIENAYFALLQYYYMERYAAEGESLLHSFEYNVRIRAKMLLFRYNEVPRSSTKAAALRAEKKKLISDIGYLINFNGQMKAPWRAYLLFGGKEYPALSTYTGNPETDKTFDEWPRRFMFSPKGALHYKTLPQKVYSSREAANAAAAKAHAITPYPPLYNVTEFWPMEHIWNIVFGDFFKGFNEGLQTFNLLNDPNLNFGLNLEGADTLENAPMPIASFLAPLFTGDWAVTGQKNPGYAYSPIFVGKRLARLRELASNSEYWAKGTSYSNSTKLGAIASLNQYIAVGTKTESVLMRLLMRANLVDLLLNPYSNEMFQGDIGKLGPWFGPGVVKLLLTYPDIGMKWAETGNCDEMVTLIKDKFPKASVDNYSYLRAKKGAEFLATKAKLFEAGTGEYLDSLDPSLAEFLKSQAKLEVMADAAASESDSANSLGDQQLEQTAKLENANDVFEELNAKVVIVDKKLKSAHDQYFDLLEVQTIGNAELSDLEAKFTQLLAARTNLKRQEIHNALETSECINTLLIIAQIQKERTKLAEATIYLSSGEKSKKFSIASKDSEGNIIIVETSPKESPAAKKKLADALKSLKEAEKKSQEAAAAAALILKGLQDKLGKSGDGTLIPGLGNSVDNVLLPEIAKHLKKKKEKKAGFPWVLLLAGAGAVTGAIPVAAAAGIGALGLYIQGKSSGVK